MPDLLFYQEPYTLVFDEDDNKFESFLSFHPEMMGCLNTTLLTFKDGQLWKHTTQATYCNFYGIQYPCYITAVFGGDLISKKTWISVMTNGNTVWGCPEIYTQMDYNDSFISSGQIYQKQQSELLESDFKGIESEFHASFLRDKNTSGSWTTAENLINGNQLKGVYIVIKFQKTYPTYFVYLNSASVKFINSPLNAR